MTDCFDDSNPLSCYGLGSRLRASIITTNHYFPFSIADWEDFDDCQWFITVSELVHRVGDLPMTLVQKKVGAQFVQVGAETVFDSTGTFYIMVPKRPDLRFEGRVVIDG